MRALIITVGTLIFAAGFVAGGRLQSPVGAQGFTVIMDCGVSSAAQVRTTLYFSIARRSHSNPFCGKTHACVSRLRLKGLETSFS